MRYIDHPVTITLDRDDLGALLVDSARYSFPRSSYMPSWVAHIVRDYVGYAGPRWAGILARDIREAKDEYDRWDREHPEMPTSWGVECFVGLLPMLDEMAKRKDGEE